MAKKYLLILSVFTLLLSACLDEVKVPLRQATEQLILEGSFTNDAESNFLRLSLSTQYGNVEDINPARGVFVEVRNSKGEKTVFKPVVDEVGVYRPDNLQFAGKVGESYAVFIKLPDGREFLSKPEKITVPVPIQSMSANFQSKPSFGFNVFVDIKDPKESENFYRWESLGYHVRASTGVAVGYGGGRCCSRCYVLKKGNEILTLSDANTNGNTIKAIPVYYSPYYELGKHLIEVKQRSISRQAFQFWRRYKEQRTRTGSIFDPLPAQLTGNVANINNPNDIALGYFEVAAIVRKKMTIPTDSLEKYKNAFNNSLYKPEGDCMLNFPSSTYLGDPPKGWN
jgi:Domain of unknown function (DUF4249)